MDFDSTKFCKNVREVAKRRGMKIGDLETAIGVSPGYMSRTENASSTPSTAFIVNAASILKCSIDFLVYGNAACFTGADLIMYDFLRKLQADTAAGKLPWTTSGGICSSPFIDCKTIYTTGAPIKGAWKQVKFWAEGEAAAADEAGNSENAEAQQQEKPQYVMYDESVNKNPDVSRLAREVALEIKNYAESAIAPDALAIMQSYLAES